MSKVTKDYNKSEWCNYFYLSEESPSGLAWRVDRGNGKTLQGSVAGYVSSTGHWKVELKGKSIQVHRIVYYFMTGDLPDNLVIDHIDGDPGNNAYTNLRAVETQLNSRNRKRAKNCSTGKMGVHEIHCFVANWFEGGKLFSKKFNVSVYGDKAFQLASEYRDAQISRLNALGYGYTDNHGN